MSRYNRPYMNPASKPRPWPVHPVWRGIGCLLVIMLPIIAYAGANLLVRQNFQQRWVALPDELVQSFTLPFLGRIFLADLAVTFALLVIGFGLLTVLYSFLFGLFGPPKYGPLDAPPEKRPRGSRR